MNKDKLTEERYEIAEIIARESHYQNDTWDASDYEWAAHCLQVEGYHKQREGEWKGNGSLRHCSECWNVVNFNVVI